MRTLLAIISCQADNEILARNWPFLKLPGWDILQCGTENGKAIFPESGPQLNTGKIGRINNQAGSVIFGLCEQELDALRWFLERPEYESIAIAEADNIFVRQPPDHPGDGIYLVTALPNYSRHGLFQNPIYFSTPRIADRKCASHLHHYGRQMLAAGQNESLVSDRFMAYICHRHNIPWLSQPGWSQSAFHHGAASWQEAWTRDAMAAIKIGCYALHSVKHQWQIDALKDLLPCPA